MAIHMTSKAKKKRLPIRNIRRAKYAELGLVAMAKETGLKPELDGWDVCVVDLLETAGGE